MRHLKIVVEAHDDGFVAYPVGLRGAVVGQGDTCDGALADVTSAIRFHFETFGAVPAEKEGQGRQRFNPVCRDPDGPPIPERPDGRLVVVDFKTGSTSSAPSRNTVKDEIQLNLYALAVLEEFGELPAEAAYLYLKETKYIPYVPTEATIGAFRERLSGLVGSVLAGEFPSRPSYDCRWCDYREICEGGPAE